MCQEYFCRQRRWGVAVAKKQHWCCYCWWLVVPVKFSCSFFVVNIPYSITTNHMTWSDVMWSKKKLQNEDKGNDDGNSTHIKVILTNIIYLWFGYTSVLYKIFALSTFHLQFIIFHFILVRSPSENIQDKKDIFQGHPDPTYRICVSREILSLSKWKSPYFAVFPQYSYQCDAIMLYMRIYLHIYIRGYNEINKWKTWKTA